MIPPELPVVVVDLVLPLCNAATITALSCGPGPNSGPVPGLGLPVDPPLRLDDDCDDDATAHPAGLPSSTDSTMCFDFALQVYKERVLGTTLRPLLFEAPTPVVKRTLRCLLRLYFAFDQSTTVSAPRDEASIQYTQHCHKNKHGARNDKPRDGHGATFLRRRVRLRIPRLSPSNKKDDTADQKMMIRIVVRPPLATHPMFDMYQSLPIVFDDYLFTGLLLRWEHQMIQAMSLAGYIATLGGGFFLCHHFTTAIYLARLQQHLALFLNDEAMYYTCAIHQAYSHVYAGHFTTAWSMLQQIRDILQSSPEAPPSTTPAEATSTLSPSQRYAAVKYHPVLIQMCNSAILFCKRMRKNAALTESRHRTDLARRPSTTNGTCTTASSSTGSAQSPQLLATVIHQDTTTGTVSRIRWDDNQRIRVVHDKSKVNDLVIPFSRALQSC